MKPSKGYSTSSRGVLKKPIREKGKPKLTKFLYEYTNGDSVIIKIDSSQQKAIPHRRYHGRIGEIIDKRGRGYIVRVTLGNSTRELIVRTEHLEPYKGT
jgi:large subunit ribosomal protein L21e